MELKRELPRKSGSVYICCHEKTEVNRMRVRTKMMADPPDSGDKYVHILHWQCVIVEKHNGEVWQTSNEA